MPLLINLRNLEKKDLDIQGELTAAELELENLDEMARLAGPVRYDLEVQKVELTVLVQGELQATVDCQCVRCLKAFQLPMEIDWAAHLVLEGDDKVEVINDSVDLTPHIREDILLGFPRHPVCGADCPGLPGGGMAGTGPGGQAPGEWSELDKLKL